MRIFQTALAEINISDFLILFIPVTWKWARFIAPEKQFSPFPSKSVMIFFTDCVTGTDNL